MSRADLSSYFWYSPSSHFGPSNPGGQMHVELYSGRVPPFSHGLKSRDALKEEDHIVRHDTTNYVLKSSFVLSLDTTIYSVYWSVILVSNLVLFP